MLGKYIEKQKIYSKYQSIQ